MRDTRIVGWRLTAVLSSGETLSVFELDKADFASAVQYMGRGNAAGRKCDIVPMLAVV